MRVKTLEIRWHESTPIYALDYQIPAASIRKIPAPRIQRDLGSSSFPSSPGHSNVNPAQFNPPSPEEPTSELQSPAPPVHRPLPQPNTTAPSTIHTPPTHP